MLNMFLVNSLFDDVTLLVRQEKLDWLMVVHRLLYVMEFIDVENALIYTSLTAYPDKESHYCTLVAYLCPSSRCSSFFGDDNSCVMPCNFVNLQSIT
jgi:hypothetical protein